MPFFMFVFSIGPIKVGLKPSLWARFEIVDGKRIEQKQCIVGSSTLAKSSLLRTGLGKFAGIIHLRTLNSRAKD